FKEIDDDVLKELTMLIQNEHLQSAYEIAKEIRSAYLFNFKEKKLQSITLSIGVSAVNSSVKASNDLLIHAKEACIKAKEYDHNQVVIWENENGRMFRFK
ncbi:16013_t:CDS:2, partial [Dentiscutata heterogama]